MFRLVKFSLTLFSLHFRSSNMFLTSQCGECSPPPAAQASLDPILLIRALIRRPGVIINPWVVCLSVCFYVCMCLFVSWVCVCLCLHITVSLCVSICVPLCVYKSDAVCVSMWVFLDGVCVCVCDCVAGVHSCVSACVHVHMWEPHLGWLSEGEAYLSIFICQLPTWDTGTQLSSPL